MRATAASRIARRAAWLRGRGTATDFTRRSVLLLFRDVTSSIWPDAVDEVLGGDQAVMFASLTPARGVVLTPVTNFAIRDRAAGTVTVNSSVGAPRKLERLRRDPRVALAFHTRAHARATRPEYVLVQGKATLGEPIDGYAWTIEQEWERAADPLPSSALWRGWLGGSHRRGAGGGAGGGVRG